MDSGIILGIVVSAAVIGVLLFLVSKKAPPKKDEAPIQQRQQQQDVQEEREEPQQGNKGLSRMKARQRKTPANPTYEPEPAQEQNQAQIDADSDNENENENEAGASGVAKGKFSKKKMEREARKDMNRKIKENQERVQEARKRREEEKEEEYNEEREEELAKERALEEDLRKIREERERREEDEYNKMKSMITVEEKGDAELAEEEKARISSAIIDAVTKRKVVVMEDLAGELQIRTRDIIDNIKELETSGKLSGVMDDRGKYIFITQEELEKVAKFIIKKGRVSIEDIAFESNKLINLEPVAV